MPRAAKGSEGKEGEGQRMANQGKGRRMKTQPPTDQSAPRVLLQHS